jgi:hypothetical protein
MAPAATGGGPVAPKQDVEGRRVQVFFRAEIGKKQPKKLLSENVGRFVAFLSARLYLVIPYPVMSYSVFVRQIVH